MYSASFGRFMQTDPIGYADGVNWYAYGQNDPINRSDPFGLNDTPLSDWRTAGSYSDLEEIVVRGCGRICSQLQTLRDAFIKSLFPTTPVAPPPLPRTGCPNVPVAPPGVNVNDNIEVARKKGQESASARHVSTPYGPAPNPAVLDAATWFYGQVNYGGPWDYKTQNPAGTNMYTDFGNFNYGATGMAVGFSEGTLLWGAGIAQAKHDIGQGQLPSSPSTRFDDPSDPPLIQAGIEYFKNGCH